jgi:phosphoribosylformimino-5-aminoimidazole carboxamide ribotide isomerase
VKLYPAIDVLDGGAVRLVKGDFRERKVYDEDPLRAAQRWVQEGARRLHLVDLDGAHDGRPRNLEHLRRIAELGVPVQFGGGLRSLEAVEAAVQAGAARVILGTAIFTQPELPAEAIERYGAERVLVSIDARDGCVATHGWLQATTVPAREAIERWHAHGEGVRNFVFTNIEHDGMLDGIDRSEAEMAARAASNGGVILSGGIGELEHLRALARLREELALGSLDGVIVGKALYEGRFTLAEAQEALGE